MLCLSKNTCFRTVFWPKTSGKIRLLYFTDSYTLCVVTSVDLMLSSCCYTIYPQSTLLDATAGLVVFSFWWLQPVCLPKLLLGDCWGWDCAFLNGFVVHDAVQHICVMHTRLCVRLGFRGLSEKESYLHRIDWPTDWTVAAQFVQHSSRGEQYVLHSVHAGL